jgi:hypothetical protein
MSSFHIFDKKMIPGIFSNRKYIQTLSRHKNHPHFLLQKESLEPVIEQNNCAGEIQIHIVPRVPLSYYLRQ